MVRSMVGVAGLALAVLLGGCAGAMAEWPERAVRWIVPFGPGGANDLIARVVAEAVRKNLNQPIVIENRPGAGAVVGTAAAAKSPPDGYTFLIGGNGVITNSLLLKDVGYADSDLVPVGMMAVAPSVIVVGPDVPASNMSEFVAWAKQQDRGGANWSTAGNGSTPHFVAEMIKDAAGVPLTIVPFRSGNDSINAILGKTVSATSEASIVALPQIEAGLLKPIATTYSRRITSFPSLATTAEQGFPTVEIGHWAGLLAPKGTPQAVIERMNAELQAALQRPDVAEKLSRTGIEAAGGSVSDFAAFIERERKRLGDIAVRANMVGK